MNRTMLPTTREGAALVLGVAALLVVARPDLASAQRRRSAALVQPSFDDAAEDDPAREHFYAGVTLYEGGDRDGAVEEFRASYELREEPVVAYNVAQVLREMRRYDEAVAWYTRYLDIGGDRISRSRRRRVESLVRRLSRVLVPLTLEVSPPGAEVRIDGRSVGVAPFEEPILVSPGERRIEVSADGYVVEETDLHVRARHAMRATYTLVRDTSLLRVTADPPQATILVDGVPVGAGDVQRSLGRGSHVVEAVHDAYERRATTVRLDTLDEMDVHLVLEPEPRREEVWETWWFWTLVGVGVAGAAAGVTAGVVVATQ